MLLYNLFFFFQAEDGIRDDLVTGVQTCALPISDDGRPRPHRALGGQRLLRLERPRRGRRAQTGFEPARQAARIPAERNRPAPAGDAAQVPLDVARSIPAPFPRTPPSHPSFPPPS